MMTTTLADLNSDSATRMKAVARVAYALSTAGFLHDVDDVAGTMAQRGFGRHVKSITTADDVAVTVGPLSAAFLRVLGQQTIDGRLPGALRLPLTAGVRLQASAITATQIGEAAPKTTSHVLLSPTTPPMTKTVGEIILTAEAARATDAATQSAISQLVADAVARGVDGAFVTQLMSAGQSTSDPHPGALLQALSGGVPSRPAIVGSLADLLALPPRALADLRDLGVAIIPSPAAVGVMLAIDASGIAILADDEIGITTARHATVELPASPDPVVVSLWQQNAVAIRAERFVRFAIRPGAVAYASTGSPS